MSSDVWLLLGHKAGDNNQVLALAEELRWPWQEKRIRYRRWEILSNRLLPATLAGTNRSESSPLQPPWPDLVITSGRRNEPVARWIKRSSAGHSRIVHIGRPWAHPSAFDLVITTPQYDVPPAPNVLCLQLPLHRLSNELLQRQAANWGGRLARLPSPRTAVLIGGNSGDLTLTVDKARQLGRMANGLARARGGSLLLTDSARTPPGVLQAVIDEIEVPSYCHRFGAAREENPYLAFLAMADDFVITSDSMSMLSEAVFTTRPVRLFDPRDGRRWWLHAYNYRFDALVHRFAMTCGPRRMRRDTGRIVEALRRQGRVAWLGGSFEAGTVEVPLDERRRAALAVAALFTS